MGIIFLLIVGAAAGFLATRIMRVEADILTTVALGVFGALIGGLLIRILLTITGALAGLVGAVLGAMALIWAYQTYIGRR
ncbi:GlsB/YeaQ/YmgE family stress response membrane protein [Rhodovulum sulfidophilum]|uniref:GlsB/YeaQ/YmgE family stress response membrane protein n=1 Tax=Rhodovulum sulfidophilum TaxID=35806 RepID=UPI00138A582C|nr:GlsB/YeaQ/YmgE family stress response membrane protein [Rhodovulum sulfidophilum]NDK34617.1 GlsB/YeaQ/YmgE family stress response membrane protein [Rhodovulum sulfidophilum]